MERVGSHGLFGDVDATNLNTAMAELESYTGNVWTHIISLRREDAARLGYNNAVAWRNLIRAHRNDIAAAMKIPPNDFRWYAAFHDEDEHPHVHMMAWSADPKRGYLSKEGIRRIKSRLTNDIFRDEMLHLYEQKSESRDELVREARRAMLEMVRSMREKMCDHPDAERLMMELAVQLETIKGKKSYGYLPKQMKALVDDIVNEMERLPVVRDCYEQWLVLQGKVDSYYHDNPRNHVPLSQQKQFRQIKNAVIREAERLRLGEVTFEERDIGQHDEPEEFQHASYDYWRLRDVIRNDDIPMEDRMDAVNEMEQMAEDGDMYAQYLMGKLWRDGPLLIPNAVNARTGSIRRHGRVIWWRSTPWQSCTSRMILRCVTLSWGWSGCTSPPRVAVATLCTVWLRSISGVSTLTEIRRKRWSGLLCQQSEATHMPNTCWANCISLVKKCLMTRRKLSTG